MHQEGIDIIRKSNITGNAVVINQCENEKYEEFYTDMGYIRMYSTKERGLTKSRNMAIEKSDADICMLCDDDEVFVKNYENKIVQAYEKIHDADVIIFKMKNRPPSFEDKIIRLKFPKTMKVSSWQISFKKQSLKKKGIKFDELLGAGTGNGAEEELKFLWDCEKAGLKIYYVPTEIASVAQTESTWFKGFSDEFFYNRGATTRYIMGMPLAIMYAFYYCIKKRKIYSLDISEGTAIRKTLKGIVDNKITKQAALLRISKS
ncbi:MAG: glycosyltransferase family 2 protein [Lachnospiraceae bacterium]|nr:glycosyltransferase family 2 protein [Lachnospiraceae bacterium]